MPSLNQIADEVAGALDRPFDDMFKQRVKELIKNERALLLREQSAKYSVDDMFRQRYTSRLILVDKGDGLANIGCNVLRTENKIPRPVRVNRRTPFSYVGSADLRNPYRHIEPIEFSMRNLLPLLGGSSGAIGYSYINGYVYIHGNLKLDYITLDAIYESPELIIPNETASNISSGIEYTDDMEFPISRDLIQRIKERLLSGELSITDSKDKISAEHLDNN